MEITQNLVMTIYKGNGFFVKIVLFNPSLFFFLCNQKHEASDLGKNASSFFFPVKKVAFFSQFFFKAAAASVK